MAQKLLSLNNLFLPSPIERYSLFGRTIYVKHDDKIHPYLSGNKFRKLQSLYESNASNLTTVISYGGTQSNAMLSIAALCYKKGWEFVYYTKKISNRIQEVNESNFSLSLDMNMQVIELDEYKEGIAELHERALFFDDKTLLIAQGAADELADKGMKRLADEIDESIYDDLHVVVASGTGTTALYLATHLNSKVYTTACVGNIEYLKTQMQSLQELPENLHFLPTKRKYHFAKPHKELYDIYSTCKAQGLHVDLLYASVMLKALSEHIETIEGDILYIHSGGLIGNASMISRYNYKGIF